jgi:outer membrane immunogenic protein
MDFDAFDGALLQSARASTACTPTLPWGRYMWLADRGTAGAAKSWTIQAVARHAAVLLVSIFFVSSAHAATYPPFPFVYQNLFRAANALNNEMDQVILKGCLDDADKRKFAQRVARLDKEIDQQLNSRRDAGELFIRAAAHPGPYVQSGDMELLPVLAGGPDAIGTSPRYELNRTKQGLDQTLRRLDGLPDCDQPDVPWVAPGEMNYDMSFNGPWSGLSMTGSGGVAAGGGNWNTTSVISLGAGDPLADSLKSLARFAPDFAVNVAVSYQIWAYLVTGVAVEFDYSWIAMDPGIPGTGAIGTPATRSNDSVTVKMKEGVALLGRLGYLVTPNTLLYATGGPAWKEISATINCTGAGVCGANGIPAFAQTNSTFAPGYTIGVGVETKLSGAWRGRFEYRYSKFDTFSTSFGTPANLAVATNIDTHMSSFRLGLTYAFGRH